MKSRLSIVFILSSFAFSLADGNKISKYIQQKVEQEKVSADGIYLLSTEILPTFYRKTNFQPAWSDPKNREELLITLEDAINDGLLPDDYHLSRIKRLMEEVQSTPDPSKSADIDLLMTDGILLYAEHLITGKVDQSKIVTGWDIPPKKIPEDAVERIENVLREKHVRQRALELRPDLNMYKFLQKNLKQYRQIAAEGGWPQIPAGETMKKGKSDPRVPLLKKYLMITGDMPRHEVDSSNTMFDEELEKAVINFQSRHNLNQDGVVGKGTLEALNVPIKKRIEQIRINLERTRWVGYNIPDDFLVVNIAGFNLRRIKNGSVVFFSRVIVGKHYHETPIFRNKIKYIILNPTWTVPYSIATKEMLPKLKRDPSYLSKHNMIIMNSKSQELDPSNIDFNKYSEKRFPFIIQQKAGPHNALGQVKFIFPNKYNVYLHDTPARSLFAREDRAFSHGCIRVEKKWELMLNLLKDPSWNMERIKKILASGKTTRINLKQPEDILLLYWTAGAIGDNIFFSRDIYNRDPAVLKELNKPVTYQSVSP